MNLEPSIIIVTAARARARVGIEEGEHASLLVLLSLTLVPVSRAALITVLLLPPLTAVLSALASPEAVQHVVVHSMATTLAVCL